MSALAETLTVSIHKSDAVLCENCEHIGKRQQDGRCPRCGSEAVINLTTVLDREEYHADPDRSAGQAASHM